MKRSCSSIDGWIPTRREHFSSLSIYRKTEDFDGSASVAEGGLPEGKEKGYTTDSL